MKAVTVGDLIYKLSEYGADVEVRIMHQQSWPLQEVIGGVWENYNDECDECGDRRAADHHRKTSPDFLHKYVGRKGDEHPVLYLIANGHPRDDGYAITDPYGDKRAWAEMERV